MLDGLLQLQPGGGEILTDFLIGKSEPVVLKFAAQLFFGMRGKIHYQQATMRAQHARSLVDNLLRVVTVMQNHVQHGEIDAARVQR